VKTEQGYNNLPTSINRHFLIDEALCRAIKQHEATKQEYSDFRQKVSNAVVEYRLPETRERGFETLKSFIIPAPKPDPMVVLCDHIGLGHTDTKDMANDFRAALDALGFEIGEKGR
jgi:hypothetical protein